MFLRVIVNLCEREKIVQMTKQSEESAIVITKPNSMWKVFQSTTSGFRKMLSDYLYRVYHSSDSYYNFLATL